MRRAGREFRAGRARSHGLHLGAHPGAQSADDRRLGQGFRPRPVRGLQGLRKRRAVRRRLRRRPPASTTARRWSPARRSATAAPACIWRSASWPRSISATPPAAARRCWPRCRTACSICAASSCAISSAWSAHRGDGRVSAISERQVRRCGAARRQRLGRRPARLDPQMQGLGDRSQRLHLLHHAGAGLEGHLRGHRPRGMADRSALRDAEGAPAAPDGNLRPDRGMDQDQDQVRGDGHPQQARHSLAARSCR